MYSTKMKKQTAPYVTVQVKFKNKKTKTMKTIVRPNAIRVDKNIPIPMGKYHYKYPLSLMEVGDSFLIIQSDFPTTGRSGIFAYVSQFAKRNNKKFTLRTVDGGVRCWRVE